MSLNICFRNNHCVSCRQLHKPTCADLLHRFYAQQRLSPARFSVGIPRASLVRRSGGERLFFAPAHGHNTRARGRSICQRWVFTSMQNPLVNPAKGWVCAQAWLFRVLQVAAFAAGGWLPLATIPGVPYSSVCKRSEQRDHV